MTWFELYFSTKIFWPRYPFHPLRAVLYTHRRVSATDYLGRHPPGEKKENRAFYRVITGRRFVCPCAPEQQQKKNEIFITFYYFQILKL
jgi:hypothetical protein